MSHNSADHAVQTQRTIEIYGWKNLGFKDFF